MGVDFKPERKADIDALFNTLEGKLQVIEPLPEPPRGAKALRYMEENRDPELLEPFVCYVPTGHGTPHQTLPLGAMINFRYISNTIIVHPYTK